MALGMGGEKNEVPDFRNHPATLVEFRATAYERRGDDDRHDASPNTPEHEAPRNKLKKVLQPTRIATQRAGLHDRVAGRFHHYSRYSQAPR
jgi:hypothetical protein